MPKQKIKVSCRPCALNSGERSLHSLFIHWEVKVDEFWFWFWFEFLFQAENVLKDLDQKDKEMDSLIAPDGSRKFPAKTCYDLFLDHGNFESGELNFHGYHTWGNGYGRYLPILFSGCSRRKIIASFDFYYLWNTSPNGFDFELFVVRTPSRVLQQGDLLITTARKALRKTSLNAIFRLSRLVRIYIVLNYAATGLLCAPLN